jgi:hypothetical protein
MELSEVIQMANKAAESGRLDSDTGETLCLLAQSLAALAAALDIRFRSLERQVQELEHQVRSR